MGKKLIIKGADFAQNSILSKISSSQTDAGGFYDFTNGSLVTSVTAVKGISKISCEGYSQLYFLSGSDDNLQPNAVSFWNGSSFLCTVVWDGDIHHAGVGIPIGSYVFTIPTGATHFSYVYENTYGSNNFQAGLSLQIYVD